jgi:hypothetical protein
MGIALITPSSTDGCAVYRSIGVFSPDAYTLYEGRVGYSCWQAILRHPIIFMQRPFSLAHLDLITTAKALGRKVVIDWDDDLTTVPPSNPSHSYFKDHRIWEISKLADLVLVSTPTLLALHPGSVVVPNAIHPVFRNLPPQPKRRRAVVWRGSPTHDEDYFPTPQFLNLRKLGYEVIAMGSPPPNLKPDTIIPFMDYAQYIVTLNYIAPEYVFASLADDPFNHAKSDVVAQEAYLIGAKFIHNDTAAYRNLPETAPVRWLTKPREELIWKLLSR